MKWNKMRKSIITRWLLGVFSIVVAFVTVAVILLCGLLNSYIENSIKDTIESNDYDHIFVIIRLGNEEYTNDIQINDWIGLRINGLLWNRIFKYKITKFI